jgi:hypothetical protein
MLINFLEVNIMTANEIFASSCGTKDPAPACGSKDPAPACGTKDPAPACGSACGSQDK